MPSFLPTVQGGDGGRREVGGSSSRRGKSIFSGSGWREAALDFGTYFSWAKTAPVRP